MNINKQLVWNTKKHFTPGSSTEQLRNMGNSVQDAYLQQQRREEHEAAEAKRAADQREQRAAEVARPGN